MSLENVHEEVAAERSPAALHEGDARAGGVATQPLNVVAFKFGGSSLLGAGVLHAASLIRQRRGRFAGDHRRLRHEGRLTVFFNRCAWPMVRSRTPRNRRPPGATH